MKKLISALFLLIATLAFSADVKPFYFPDIPDDEQQAEWEILMKYKTFGANELTFGNELIRITDKSGWVGTSKGNFTLGQNGKDTVGGPIIIGGDLVLKGRNEHFSTGPVNVYGDIRVEGDVAGFKANPNNNKFEGYQCVKGNVDEAYAYFIPAEYQFFGDNYENCPIKDTHVNDTRLMVPTLKNDEAVYATFPADGSSIDNKTVEIVVPAGSYKEPYDIYIDKITLVNSGKLVIKQQVGGRLTRIFLQNGITFSSQSNIVVAYCDEDNNCSELANEDYSGTLLFYTEKNISFPSFDKAASLQGSFISYGTISIAHHLTLAGQILANNVKIDTDFDGHSFLYVPFDPPILNIDPTAIGSGIFIENNIDTRVDIHLDTLAKTDVHFKYCFDLTNSDASIDDFNNNVPVCGTSYDSLTILAGTKAPTTDLILNVKVDGITENKESLKLKIYDLEGAVLPGNVHSGYFTLYLEDGNVFNIDTTQKYSVDENTSNIIIGNIVVKGITDTTKFYILGNTDYTINETTGEITIVTPLDYETQTTDTVKVVIVDGTSELKDTADIIIAVNDINEKPIVKNQTLTISENAPVPSTVGTVVWSDIDTAEKFRNNKVEIISGNDDGIFSVSQNTIYSTKIFDYETDQKSYELVVRVVDKDDPTLYEDATITINITDVNEAPIVKTDVSSIDENTIGTVAVITATDPEGKPLTYTLDNKKFTIDENGVITNTEKFNYEKDSLYTVIVTVSDGVNKVLDTIKVKVNDVNEPVSIDDKTVSIFEDQKTGIIDSIKAVDEDLYGKITYELVDTTNTFTIDNNGNIILTKEVDYEKDSLYTITVKVSDGYFTDSAIVTVKIKNVNETPVVTSDPITVEENYTGVVGKVDAVDPDNDKLTYSVVDSDMFSIDDNGNVSVIKPFDYEAVKETTVKINVTDGKDTVSITVPVSIVNVNEPIHVNDTTFTIPENKTGEVGKVTAWDEDNDKITYSVLDTTKYSIDQNGVISVKVPFDYENQKVDSVTVIVTDGKFYDTTTVKINVQNENETSDVKIVHTDTRDSVYTSGPVYTNDKNIQIAWNTDGKLQITDTTVHEGKNVIKLCYQDPTKDAPACDSVEIYMSTAAPVVTVAKVESSESDINGIKIVEEQESSDNNIYVNTQLNDIKVTVKDTVTDETEDFIIKVKLDTISVKSNVLKDFGITFNENATNIKHTIIAEDKIKISEIEVINGDTVEVSYIADSKGNRIDTVQTITYNKVIDGKVVTISYDVDYLDGSVVSDYKVSYEYVDNAGNTAIVSYTADKTGKIVKNDEGSTFYTVSYTYTNKYGNSSTAEVKIVLDTIVPVVKIVTPTDNMSWKQNSIQVVWTVNGIEQDTLTLERLEPGVNRIIRQYEDKAGNIGGDTVLIYMENAKAIDIKLINSVTEIDQEYVDEYYSKDNKYDPKKPYKIIIKDNDSSEVKPVGVGFNINIALPTVSSTGGMATVDDMIQVVKGQSGILVDKDGNLKSGTSTGADGSHVIPVDDYIKNHCNADYQIEYQKHGLEGTAIWDITYSMHIWIYNTNSSYVNDFNVKYTLNSSDYADEAGIVHMVMDLIPDKDGHVKAANKKNLGTGSYIYKLNAKSKSKLRCDLPNKKIGNTVTKNEDDLTVFGYKRPLTK